MVDVREGVRPPAALAATVLLLAACGDGRGPSNLPAIAPLTVDIPAPAMRRGDFWEYEARGGDAPSRWSLEVESVEPNGHFRARRTAPRALGSAETAVTTAEYAGPWNAVQPVPAWSRTFLRFPLRQGERWTSTAVGPGEMTWMLAQEVRGRQILTIAGSAVECVRVEGIETTSTTMPPPVSVAAQVTLWYCPELRGVGRVDTAIPNAPVVTQTLLAFRPGVAP